MTTKRLPALSYRKVARALERAGFRRARVTGSHHYFKHSNDPSIVVSVPRHGKDIKRGLLFRIIKYARLTVEEFLDLL